MGTIPPTMEKITLYLHKADLARIRAACGYGYTARIREAVHDWAAKPPISTKVEQILEFDITEDTFDEVEVEEESDATSRSNRGPA